MIYLSLAYHWLTGLIRQMMCCSLVFTWTQYQDVFNKGSNIWPNCKGQHTAFSALSSFSLHHVRQNCYSNFLKILLFRYMSLWAGESERIFYIAFMTSLTFQLLALTPAFRDPDTICKLPLSISASFGSSFFPLL